MKTEKTVDAKRNALALAARAVEAAQRAGADDAEAYVRAAGDLHIYWRGGQVENITRASALGLGLRVTTGGRTLLVHTTDTAPDALADLAGRAVAMARTLPEPAEPTLYAGPADAAAQANPDPDLAGEPLAAKTERLAAMERAMLGVAGVTASNGCEWSESAGAIAMASTRGLSVARPFVTIEASAQAVAEAPGDSSTGGRWVNVPARRYLPDPGELGRTAGARAAALLGARPVPTTRAPVIFTPFTGYAVLACLTEPLRGDMVVQERSYLRASLGEAIAAPGVTIVDDPTLPEGPASRDFDGEGMPCRRRALIDGGVLAGFLTDLGSARKLGVAPGGNTGRDGYDQGPRIAPSNFLLRPGDATPAEIIASTQRGLIVEGLSGWWVGRSAVTDAFSSAAKGFWVEDGVIVHPVAGVSVAGSLREMLRAVDAVGDDLAITGRTATPTFRVAEMAISGT
ncbi:MAG: TldD/PmbA family protein [Candidatus Krumholzibacteriota bacterium]|nr:TldD/PmbA family protein [Candidatus Krumholzibacteriota bacterium]